jgi:Kef-type K+ transport system membrane component KefB
MSVYAAPVPPLSSHQVLLFLLQVGVLLALATCLGRLAMRCGLPAVVGELSTGLLLGPTVLGLAAPDVYHWLLPARPDQTHLLDALSLVAVLLFVGVTGAHLQQGLLRRRAGAIVRISLGGLLVPLALGIGTGLLIPRSMVGPDTSRVTFALMVGVAMCVSAIPVIAKTLSDMRLLHRDVGQLTMAAASMADAVGWFLLSVVSAFATRLVPGRIAVAALYLVGFALLAVLVGGPVIRLVLRWAGRYADPTPTVAGTVVVILLGAAAAQALGLEAVFGAFVAGILVGSAPGLAPVRLSGLRTIVLSVLAPIFLATAGLRVDLTALGRPEVLVTGIVVLVLAVLGKFAGAYTGARLSRLSHWEGLAVAAGLNARGAVEIVVATVGLQLGVMTVPMYTIVILLALLTSVMAPPVLRYAMARVEHTAEERLREAETGWTSAAPDPAVAG